jgi:hypothetical protein
MDELINNISTLASVYHKPPKAFMGNRAFSADAVKKAAAAEYVIRYDFFDLCAWLFENKIVISNHRCN